MQNYLKYTNKTNGTFFPGNVIYDLWAQKFCKVCRDVCKLW